MFDSPCLGPARPSTASRTGPGWQHNCETCRLADWDTALIKHSISPRHPQPLQPPACPAGGSGGGVDGRSEVLKLWLQLSHWLVGNLHSHFICTSPRDLQYPVAAGGPAHSLSLSPSLLTSESFIIFSFRKQLFDWSVNNSPFLFLSKPPEKDAWNWKI